MSMHTKRAQALGRYYDQAIRRPDTDRDEAVEYAIRQVFMSASEDARADIYAVVRECFDKYPSGITRRLGLTFALRNYQYKRIHG